MRTSIMSACTATSQRKAAKVATMALFHSRRSGRCSAWRRWKEDKSHMCSWYHSLLRAWRYSTSFQRMYLAGRREWHMMMMMRVGWQGMQKNGSATYRSCIEVERYTIKLCTCLAKATAAAVVANKPKLAATTITMWRVE